MLATPMPEPAQPLVSLPFNLYFHGLDKPHWSAETDGFNPAPDAQRRAEKSRLLVASARRRKIASLHDSIKRLDKAVHGLSDLDETGFTDVAAQHIERRLAHTVSLARTILADITGAVDGYRTAELEAAGDVAAATPPAEVDDVEMKDAGHEYHCEEHGFHAYNDPDAGWEHDEQHRDAEDLAERDAEDLDAAADARATDQVITALAARTATPPAAEADSFPTPADIANGTVTPIRKHDVWPPR